MIKMSKYRDCVVFPDFSKITEKTKPRRNFLIERCSYCNEGMELVEKTVIFGANWYHNFCWELINKKKNSAMAVQNFRTGVSLN